MKLIDDYKFILHYILYSVPEALVIRVGINITRNICN